MSVTTLIVVWFCLALFSSVMLMLTVWWERRRLGPGANRVTLWSVMQGAFFAWCPIVNVFTSLFMLIWFCSEVAPKIVLFEGR